MSTKLTNVRLCFPDLFKPSEKFNRFGAVFPVEPGSANAKAIEAAIEQAAKDKWGAKASPVLTKLYADGTVCYTKGPKTNADGDVYNGFEGKHTLSASNQTRPTVVDVDRSPLTEADGKPYAGCYVNAIVEVWAQDNQWGRRINCTLKGVQFARDGEAFSGSAPAAADDFDDLSVGDEALA